MKRFEITLIAVLVAVCAILVFSRVTGAQGVAPDARRDYNAGRYHTAIDLLTASIAKSPSDASLHFLLGQCYYQLREYSRALTSFDRSVELDPNSSEYHDWLGRANGRRAEESNFLSAMGWAKKAHKEFEWAVELNPSNFEAQRDLIRYEMYAPGIVNGGDDRALRHIAALEKIDPLQGQLARGEFLGMKKRYTESDALFAKILDSPVDRAGVYLEVAEYYQIHRNTTKMQQAVEAASKIDPDDRRLKYYRGVLLVMTKQNPAEAETLLKTYLAKVPDNADLPPHSSAREWLGTLFESQGKASEATAEYRASLALDPHNKTASDGLKRLQKK